MKPALACSPAVEGSQSIGEFRHSLYHNRADFIQRVGPIGMAAIYFGAFSLGPQDAALSRQALFKLSFVYRHFLKPAGLSILVTRQMAIFSGLVESQPMLTLAGVLAEQIEGISQIKDETGAKIIRISPHDLRERVQLLLATDQTFRTGLQVEISGPGLVLSGQTGTAKQKMWAEQLATSVGAAVQSRIEVVTEANAELPRATDTDDESLQALVLFRLRLVRETEHVPVKVKASRGVISLSGKVGSEALRQQVENLSRSTLGLKELRSTLTVGR